jgi:tRNA(Arg) A34 adenosine deaminase TadA
MEFRPVSKYTEHMRTAIDLAKKSLRTGNYGFGAVIIKDDSVIALTHDTEKTDGDSTAHAELKAIREASKKIGKNLAGCILISTHEPCPMCASAIVWSGISKIVFGYSITDAIKQGRNRLNIGCEEIFRRSGVAIETESGVLLDECALLYNKLVRNEIKKLRDATEEQLKEWNQESTDKRLEWLQTKNPLGDISVEDVKEKAYRMLLKKFNITEEQAPIIHRDENKIVFHSMNFCPTLEACKILNLDTRQVCSCYNENSTDTLVKQIDSRLSFERNYEKLRPYSEYCEEMIIINR